jgi:hyperosmotically inducible periplasmic protein
MNPQRITTLTLAILVSTIAAAACRDRTAEVPPAGTAGLTQRSDAELRTDVQARFYADSTVRGSDLAVSADNRIVTLSGTVPDEASKQRALEIARGVDGVARVDDRIVVQAVPAPAAAPTPRQPALPAEAANRRSPAWITTKIQAQYFTSGDVKPWNVDVTTAADGVVTLQGEVEDAQAKAEAVRIAQTTEGVSRVDDRLRIKPANASQAPPIAETVADGWLTTKIQSKYFVDDEVRARNIDVSTDNGIVTLTGTVANAEERRQAVALARNTDGVKEVKDQLEIRAPETPTAANGKPGAATARVESAVEDAWITAKIQSQYFLDPDVKGHEIDVDTRNGVVTLTGEVDTPEIKAKAQEIASDTGGASRVVNNLHVATARQ